MESIKTKITHVPQRTGYKTVTNAEVPAGSAATFGPSTHDNLKIIVPKGAIITATPIMVMTAFAGPNTVVVNTGHVAKSLDENGASLASAGEDEDAYFDGTQTLKGSNTGLYGAGSIATANWGARMGKQVSYTVSNSGDKEYSVGLFITTGDTAAMSAGSLTWWVEYMFAPNIVWEQASLA